VEKIMNVAGFTQRTQLWPRFKRAMLTFWVPLVLLAVIPIVAVVAPIIWIIIIGSLAGWIAGYLAPGPKPSGCILAVLLGIAGAFLATFVGQAIGLYRFDQGGGLLGAIVGALVVLFIWIATHKIKDPGAPGRP
jgi:uncharacterized membrane protein YeaQ/YmgE (transglycosylase-associated protein family)